MRPNEIAAEVRPYVDLDKIASQIRKLNVASQDDERLIETATKRNEERRKKIGALLIDARKGFNARGDGFKKFVEDHGIPFRTATRYMKEAGYESPKSTGDYGQNGHDSENDSPDERATGKEDSSTTRNGFDPERESVSLKNKVVSAAAKWPSQYRSKLIQELRLAIKMIEVMQ